MHGSSSLLDRYDPEPGSPIATADTNTPTPHAAVLVPDATFILQGQMAPGGPYYLPGTGESFELTKDQEADDAHGAPRPVRNDVSQAGREIVALRTWKIKKGTFDKF